MTDVGVKPYTELEVVQTASELAQSVVHSVPPTFPRALARIWIKNQEQMFRKAADILAEMLNKDNESVKNVHKLH